MDTDNVIEVISGTATTEELLLPSWYWHNTRYQPSSPRIDKWLQRPSTLVYISHKGDLVEAVNESNTLSLWIDLKRSIPFASAFRRTTLWTAAEMAE